MCKKCILQDKHTKTTIPNINIKSHNNIWVSQFTHTNVQKCIPQHKYIKTTTHTKQHTKLLFLIKENQIAKTLSNYKIHVQCKRGFQGVSALLHF
jgi:DNA-directed RNA polymerase specialized sigma54-like protein